MAGTEEAGQVNQGTAEEAPKVQAAPQPSKDDGVTLLQGLESRITNLESWAKDLTDKLHLHGIHTASVSIIDEVREEFHKIVAKL